MRIALIVGLVMVAACSNESAPPIAGGPRFDSPKACFDAALKALDVMDVDAFFTCLTPRGQTQAAGSTQLVLMGMARRDRFKSQEIFTFVNEYGFPLNDEARNREDLKEALGSGDGGKLMEVFGESIKDKAEFIKKGLAFRLGPADASTDVWDEVSLGQVTESSSTAVAELLADDLEEGSPKLHFSKVNGSWLIDRLEVTMPAMDAPPK